MYTLDTNAIIYFLKDDPQAVSVIQDIFTRQTPIYISAITEVELLAFPKLTPNEEKRIEDILRTLSIMPVDSRIAHTAGLIRRIYRLNIADSVIAATAMFTGTTLLTRNTGDFQKIPELTVQKV